MSMAMSSGKPEIFRLTKYCKLVLEDPKLSWRSRSMRALVVPSLCSPMILGLPFLTFNNLVMDYSARTVIDKSCGFDLMNPVIASPVLPVLAPVKRRRLLLRSQQELLKSKKCVFQQAASFARENVHFRCFTVSEFPVRCFNFVAAIHGRIESLEHRARLDALLDSFKSEFADVFTPIAHTSALPDDFTCSITLKDADKVFQTRGYASPRKFKDAWNTLIQQHLEAGRIRPIPLPPSLSQKRTLRCSLVG
ncbi:hypothetical protein GGU11DRAFT_572946 [Lentinula aff. detonsa]|nr:hypothetical protein GGU11DRAFT_572946 [Lentinula aff. detonsa]